MIKDSNFLEKDQSFSPLRKENPRKEKVLALASPDMTPQNFDSVRISVASPEQILSWSYGEVKRPETINYRTFKPERDGLFCARIFGPIKDYECLCGKYKRMKYRGTICERCGVEVTLMKVRRERMGHIQLAAPVAHVWFARSLPSRIGTLLDMTTRNLDRVLYFEGHVVLDPGMTSLFLHQVLSEEEYHRAIQEYGRENFRVGSGAEALKEMLIGLNLAEIKIELREELTQSLSEMRRKKVIKRLKLVEAFLSSKTRPEWMILDVLPVMPPELRPLVPLEGGRFATSDLNDLYRRLLNRNNRLRRLMELQAPEMIIRNEKRMLQEMVDAFFDNSRRGRPITGSNKRPLKSLSDMLKGKQGRFRLNLLGKRVDYSGRSVIVVGPHLKLHQCGLPKKMAIELFKPFIYERLERYGFALTIKAAKKMVERERPEVGDVLEEVIKNKTVLLNRAPTLHRLGIQAFEPVLIEGKAIQLHPLVCAAYNADFDGDQMAVHVPLSLEAQIEARVLMLSTNNILSPASGDPVIVPSKDIILGLYYLTLMRDGEKGQGGVYSGLNEAQMAYDQGVLSLHATIHTFCEEVEENEAGERTFVTKRVQTTLGRLMFWNILPRHPKISFDEANRLMTSKDLTRLMTLICNVCGNVETTVFADKMVQLGFSQVTRSGISFGKDDLVVPEKKVQIVAETNRQVSEYHQQHLDGLITQGERYNKVTDAWTKCTEQVAAEMMVEISKDVPGLPMNSVYMMASSGARGSAAQMRQLAGMRGLIARHDGSIIEHPITSNFKEGLLTLEYFNSTHGARKGLSDTALKTANAGYLTRRLVDVAQDCVIYEDDCGTEKSVAVKDVIENSTVVSSLKERVFGRVLAQDIVNPQTQEMVLPRNTLVDEKVLSKLEGILEVRVRSPLVCEAKDGICAMCYGRDLGRGRLVIKGEAVGVIAAQSIGEPGTQLTLRTFHSGGAAQRAAEASFIEALGEGLVEFRAAQLIHANSGRTLVMSRSMEIVLSDALGKQLSAYRVPYGATLFVTEGEKVEQGQKLAEWDPYTIPVIAEKEGVAYYADLIEGVSLQEVVDDITGITKRMVIDWRQASSRKEDLRPLILLKDEEGKSVRLDRGSEASYALGVDTLILVANGARVHKGDVIARIARESFKSRDITGGLPRIAELFEARRPKDPAILSECDGTIEYGKDYKGRRRLILHPDDHSKPLEYVVSKNRQILVQEGDRVSRGDLLVDGSPVPHDILAVLGVEALASYLIKEIQDVYRLQGVRINDKHIEVIVRQMLRKVEVVDPGDTTFLLGDQIGQEELDIANAEALDQGHRRARAIPVLQGITRAALHTDSFISAASFQETTRVLIEAAVQGKEDKLIGLKENVIAGRAIPAGTGFVAMHLRKEARIRDAAILKERQERLGSSKMQLEI
jgi:DNA-directed RNA polymerase subunit beta'